MNRPVAIIAGNKKQFDDYVRSIDRREVGTVDFVYIGRREDILGRDFRCYDLVWTYYENNNRFDLIEEMKLRNIPKNVKYTFE